VDHRADIFSLGVVLYEMITGEKPFFGESLTVVSHRIVYGDYTPPQEHVPGLPVKIVEMLSRALEKAPEKRYQRAGDMARAFHDALAGKDPESDSADGAAPAPDVETGGGDVLVMPDIDAELSRATAPTVAIPTPESEPEADDEPSEYDSRTQRGERSPALTLALRATTLALLAAALLILAHQGALFWLRMGEPEMKRLSVAERQRGQVLPILQAARRQMDMGRAREALELYDQALKEAPQNEQLRGLRDEAARVWSASQRRARQVQVEQARAEEVGDLVTEARTALRRGRYETAKEKGRQALRLDPDNAQVVALLQEIADAQRAALARRQQPTTPTQETPTPKATVRAPPSASYRPGAGKTSIKVDFYTDISEGILTVYEGKYQLLRRPFKFVEKKGLFRRKGTSGSIQETLEVPLGEVNLSVYASYTGSERTKLVSLKEVLKPNVDKILVIRLSAEGDLTAELQ
jgi:tetratricopeptide (TPR) repeat protein